MKKVELKGYEWESPHSIVANISEIAEEITEFNNDIHSAVRNFISDLDYRDYYTITDEVEKEIEEDVRKYLDKLPKSDVKY